MKRLFSAPNIVPKKRLGQIFLKDRKVVQLILNKIPGSKNFAFIEIGPGLGSMTIPFIKKYKKILHAIEIDKKLVEILLNYPYIHKQLRIYQQDVLTFDFTKFYYSQKKKLKLCIFGNLPYQIVTKLLFNLFFHQSVIESMFFMVQKEVGQRIVANPNNRHYGKLTVLVKYFCKSKYIFEIDPCCFLPQPKIKSAFIKLMPKKNYNEDWGDSNFKALFREIVTLAFQKRRKILSNSLKNIKNIKEILIKLDINPNLRAENLSLKKYYKICKEIFENKK